MTVVAEVQVAQAAGAMHGAVDEWVVAVDAIKTTRSSRVGCAYPLMWFCMAMERGTKKKKR